MEFYSLCTNASISEAATHRCSTKQASYKIRTIQEKPPVLQPPFNTVADLMAATLLKRESNRCFSVTFAKS